MLQLLKDLAATNNTGKPENIMELGSGCGQAISERVQELKGLYDDFSINNNVYYPVRRLLNDMIDFDTLAVQDEADKKVVVDYLYKVLYLEHGTTAQRTLQYDQSTIQAIGVDPNNLKTLLQTIGPKLAAADHGVPSEYGIVPLSGGKNDYPEQIERQRQTETVRKALDLLQTDPAKYLRTDVMTADLKERLPVFPAGMMIGDFSEIKRFKDEQIKAALSVRGTVYLEGKQYTDFLVNLAAKLKTGGVYIGDCVRENFGKRYRLGELVTVQRALQQQANLYLIIGPGVPGDDYNQEKAIRSVVMTKGEFNLDIVKQNLQPGYELRSLDDVVGNANYVKLLDPTGTNYQELQQALAA